MNLYPSLKNVFKVSNCLTKQYPEDTEEFPAQKPFLSIAVPDN
jgi:hypothetical protein